MIAKAAPRRFETNRFDLKEHSNNDDAKLSNAQLGLFADCLCTVTGVGDVSRDHDVIPRPE
jgi:hypothetical protein